MGKSSTISGSARMKRVLTYLLLSVVGFTMLIPFVWQLSTSLKRKEDVFRYPPEWIPRSDFIELEGRWVEISTGRKLRGRVRVRIDEGERMGTKLEIGSEKILREDGRAYTAVGDERKTRVTIEEILEPDRYEARLIEEEADAKVLLVPVGSIKRRIKMKFSNYLEVWRVVPFGRFYINSIIVAVIVTFGQVFTSTMAAYAFARLTFPGRDRLFFGYLATMMIPGSVVAIPVFSLFKKMPELLNYLFSTSWWSSELYLLGTIYIGRPAGMDSYFALIAPGVFSAYGTFMLRQFFMSLPRDFDDAAKIDGCGYFGIFWRIILPLSKPAIAALTIFVFMGAWRNYMWPLIMTNTRELMTLPVGIQSFQGMYNTEWTLLMAATMMLLGPMMLVFFFGQKYFIEGIRLGGVKG